MTKFRAWNHVVRDFLGEVNGWCLKWEKILNSSISLLFKNKNVKYDEKSQNH